VDFDMLLKYARIKNRTAHPLHQFPAEFTQASEL